jgi:hypothetical protein
MAIQVFDCGFISKVARAAAQWMGHSYNVGRIAVILYLVFFSPVRSFGLIAAVFVFIIPLIAERSDDKRTFSAIWRAIG